MNPSQMDDNVQAKSMRSVRNSLIVGASVTSLFFVIMVYSLAMIAKSDLPLTRMVMAEFVFDSLIAAYLMKMAADLITMALDAHTRYKSHLAV